MLVNFFFHSPFRTFIALGLENLANGQKTFQYYYSKSIVTYFTNRAKMQHFYALDKSYFQIRTVAAARNSFIVLKFYCCEKIQSNETEYANLLF